MFTGISLPRDSLASSWHLVPYHREHRGTQGTSLHKCRTLPRVFPVSPVVKTLPCPAKLKRSGDSVERRIHPLRRAHPQQVEETIFGNARQAGGGPNPARQISIRSGIPHEVPAYTVNKACASGLKSIALAFQEIATGNLECVL